LKQCRNRKEWSRNIDENNDVFWKQNFNTEKSTNCYCVTSDETNNTEPDQNTVDLKLRLDETSVVDASKTVQGRLLPVWWIHQLQELEKLNFSYKYAWLLTQLSTSVKENNYIKLKLYREFLFEESMEILMHIDVNDICLTTRILLIGEPGVDAGGLQREWYMLVTQAAFDETKGLFIRCNTSDTSYFINPNSEIDHGLNHLQHFNAVGRLMGRAILDGQALPVFLCSPFLKLITGTPISMEDIRYLDSTVYKSMCFIRDTTNVEELVLDFSAPAVLTEENSDELVDLIPNGRNISVTSTNKQHYLDCMLRYLLFDRIALQLQYFMIGIYEVTLYRLLLLAYIYILMRLLFFTGCTTRSFDAI